MEKGADNANEVMLNLEDMKKVLFLYGNRPEPLPIHMMETLGRRGGYDVKLLYYERGASRVSLPMSGLVDQETASAIAWPVGANVISKAVNRSIVLMKFVKKIRAINPDVIHAWNFDMLLAARVATLGRKGNKVVFSLQDTTQWMVAMKFRNIQRWAYRGTNLLFVTSQGFEDQFLRKFCLIGDKDPVVFVPNVPLDGQFRDFVPRTASESLTIGYIGLLRGEEGLRGLVDAASKAREEGVDVRVLFAGKGPLEDYVKDAAERYAFVDFLGPYRHDQEIREIYGKVDLLYGVYDRSYDKQIHLAYRFCEAVNCRMPIIVAEGTHMGEEVQRYGVGLCVPLGDVGRLAEELAKLCKSKERRAEIARNCEKARREFVFEHYEEWICRAYADLLEE